MKGMLIFLTAMLATSCGKDSRSVDSAPLPAAKVAAVVDDRSIPSFSMTSTEPGVLIMTWTAPVEAPNDYRIRWSKDSENYIKWDQPGGVIATTETTHTVSDLEEGVLYKGSVRARYDDGSGEWSRSTVTIAASSPSVNPPIALSSIQACATNSETGDLSLSGNTNTEGCVAVGTYATGSIGGGNDKDWFRTHLIGGTAYVIDMKGSASGYADLLDPQLQGVYDSDGDRVANGNNDGGSSLEARIEFTPSEDGEYYIGVIAATGGQSLGSYFLSIRTSDGTEISPTWTADDYAADNTTTASVTLDEWFSAGIQSPDDKDWIAVPLLDYASRYRVRVQGRHAGGGTILDPNLKTIYDGGGSIVYPEASGGDVSASDWSDEYGFWAGDDEGTFYIELNRGSGGIGTYQIMVEGDYFEVAQHNLVNDGDTFTDHGHDGCRGTPLSIQLAANRTYYNAKEGNFCHPSSGGQGYYSNLEDCGGSSVTLAAQSSINFSGSTGFYIPRYNQSDGSTSPGGHRTTDLATGLHVGHPLGGGFGRIKEINLWGYFYAMEPFHIDKDDKDETIGGGIHGRGFGSHYKDPKGHTISSDDIQYPGDATYPTYTGTMMQMESLDPHDTDRTYGYHHEPGDFDGFKIRVSTAGRYSFVVEPIPGYCSDSKSFIAGISKVQEISTCSSVSSSTVRNNLKALGSDVDGSCYGAGDCELTVDDSSPNCFRNPGISEQNSDGDILSSRRLSKVSLNITETGTYYLIVEPREAAGEVPGIAPVGYQIGIMSE